MLYGCLGLLRGWMYVHKEDVGVLSLGKEKLIDTIEASGFVLAAAATLENSLDAKYVRIHIEIDGPDRAYPIDFTPYGMYKFGLTTPISFGGFLTVYDDANKRYAGVVSPTNPIPFSKKFEVKLIPPSQPVEETTALSINYKAVYELVKIIDVEEFKASLRELFTAPVRRLS